MTEPLRPFRLAAGRPAPGPVAASDWVLLLGAFGVGLRAVAAACGPAAPPALRAAAPAAPAAPAARAARRPAGPAEGRH